MFFNGQRYTYSFTCNKLSSYYTLVKPVVWRQSLSRGSKQTKKLKKSSRNRETESKRRRTRRRSRELESKKLEHRRRIRESESGVGAEKTKNPDSEFKKLTLRSRSWELGSIKHGTLEPESEKLRRWCWSRES